MKVCVVDHCPMTICGIKHIFKKQSENFDLKSYFTSGNDAINSNEYFDLILIEINLPDMDGFDLITYLKSTKPSQKIGIYTTSYNKTNIMKAITFSVQGIISKTINPSVFIDKIKHIYEGENFVTAGDIVQNTDKPKNNINPKRADYNLTLREKEVLDLVVAGIKNKDIADVLNIATSTVEFHRKNIYTKLSVNDIAGLIRKVHDLYTEGPDLSAYS